MSYPLTVTRGTVLGMADLTYNNLNQLAEIAAVIASADVPAQIEFAGYLELISEAAHVIDRLVDKVNNNLREAYFNA